MHLIIGYYSQLPILLQNSRSSLYYRRILTLHEYLTCAAQESISILLN